ncbi:MAG: transglycosylase domain-containing protein [Bdellovibrionales bacterium]
MFWSRLNTLSQAITIFMAPLVVASPAWAFNPFTISKELDQKLQERSFLPTTEYYVASEWLRLNSLGPAGSLRQRLLELQFQEKVRENLQPGEFLVLPAEICQNQLSLPEAPFECLRLHDFLWGNLQVSQTILVATAAHSQTAYQVLGIWNESQQTPVSAWALKPTLLAQTVGAQPIMQRMTPLSGMPASCLQAVLAIEDTSFLEHSGVSMTGTLRAVLKNIVRGRKAQGGSTITQQLVKNYFLTSERTYKRKFQEMFLSFLLETKYTKDQILEVYLNIIYMAQNGAYQVLGFPAAAEYYFAKPIENLEVHECATLAAILNGPGVYNPFKNAEKTLSRRNLVLTKMREQGFITDRQFESAMPLALPRKSPAQASETSPYFLESARWQIEQLGLSLENSRILLTMETPAQAMAQKSLQGHLQLLETQNPFLQKQKDTLKKSLEGLVLSTDRNGRVLVAVGGRNYKQSQFNRVTMSRRQIGSLVKPFVFLTAIEKDGKSPLDVVVDEKFEFREGKQRWSPVNYDRKFLGPVPLYYALKTSLNAATAKLGLDVGLEKVIDTLRAAGIVTEIQPLPSLTLGALELPPLQVLQAYLTLSQMGKSPSLTFIEGVWDHQQNVLYRRPDEEPQAYLGEVATAITVGMMKPSLISGTAALAGSQGLRDRWAGKTGTTSDNKDAWFAGFGPHETTLVWVGYDDNTPTKLTGASGAVPVWTQYTKWGQGRWPEQDFQWPEDVVEKSVSQAELQEKGFPLETQSEVKLVFKKSLFGL